MVVYQDAIHLSPEVEYSQTAKITSDGRLRSIFCIQLAVPQQFLAHGCPKSRVRYHRNKIVNRLGMQVSSKPLELRGDQDSICPVDLLSRVAAATSSASH